MRSSTLLVNLVFGLLSSLIVTAKGGYPFFTTLEHHFTLRSLNPDGAHVVLNGDGTPVVTFDRRASTVFQLSKGKLTAVSSGLSAVYGPVNLPLPPLLIPVRFIKNASPQSVIPFIAETKIGEDGKSSSLILRTVREPLTIRIPTGIQNPIYVKPEGNIEPTDDIELEIHSVNAAGFGDQYDGQEFWHGFDL